MVTDQCQRLPDEALCENWKQRLREAQSALRFGRSDSRKKLRHFFEVDRQFVVLAALEALADRGDIEPKVVAEAIVKFGIDPEKRNPLDC